MENNIIKENYLEVLKDKKIVNTTKPEVLPVMAVDRKLLLPVIIQNTATSINEIKSEVSSLRNNTTLQAILRILRHIVKAIGKAAKMCIVSVIKFAVFIGIASVLVMSIGIVTKNIVNLKYNSGPKDDSEYSVFIIKDDLSEQTKTE